MLAMPRGKVVARVSIPMRVLRHGFVRARRSHGLRRVRSRPLRRRREPCDAVRNVPERPEYPWQEWFVHLHQVPGTSMEKHGNLRLGLSSVHS